MARSQGTENCRQCDKSIDLFKLLSREESDMLSQHRFEVDFNAGETIVKQGTSFTHVICISSGLVKIYLEGFNKRNLIILLVKGVEMIDGPGMWTDNRHHYSVTAVEDTSACFI